MLVVREIDMKLTISEFLRFCIISKTEKIISSVKAVNEFSIHVIYSFINGNV